MMKIIPVLLIFFIGCNNETPSVIDSAVQNTTESKKEQSAAAAQNHSSLNTNQQTLANQNSHQQSATNPGHQVATTHPPGKDTKKSTGKALANAYQSKFNQVINIADANQYNDTHGSFKPWIGDKAKEEVKILTNNFQKSFSWNSKAGIITGLSKIQTQQTAYNGFFSDPKRLYSYQANLNEIKKMNDLIVNLLLELQNFLRKSTYDDLVNVKAKMHPLKLKKLALNPAEKIVIFLIFSKQEGVNIEKQLESLHHLRKIQAESSFTNKLELAKTLSFKGQVKPLMHDIRESIDAYEQGDIQKAINMLDQIINS